MATAVESEVYDFLVTLFGDNEGIVYTPTKGQTADSFIRYYFAYPEQKNEIVQHMLQANKESKDVWIAPALLKSNKNAKKPNWLGTQFIYVDFDEGVPTSLPEGTPQPTIKIQSSVAGREHWYWKLNEFYTGDNNREAIEQVARSLAYSLGGDTGGWDATQVLRAPGTRHRVKKVLTHVLEHHSERIYTLADFVNVLPAPSKAVELKQQERDLPDILEVLSRTTLKGDAQEIFNRSKEDVGDRSAALFKFAMECLEVRPPIFKADILSMLNHLAYKWGKFDTHSERFEQVKKVLASAITKHDPKKIDSSEDLYEPEFLRTYPELAAYVAQNPANWIIGGLLPERSTMQIAGEANIGKSSLAFRLSADIICGNDFLLWQHGNSEKQYRVAYFGLDMDEGDALDLLQDINKSLSEDQRQRFYENFRISTPDYGIDLWDKKVQARYEQYIALSRANVVIFDSLKDTGALDGEDKRKAIFQWFRLKLKRDLGLTIIVLTHTRKRDKDSKVHQSQDDVFGSGMQNADIKASLLLYRTSQSTQEIHINQTKVRRAKKIPVFTVKREDDALTYNIISEDVDTSEPVPSKGNAFRQAALGGDDNVLFMKGNNES